MDLICVNGELGRLEAWDNAFKCTHSTRCGKVIAYVTESGEILDDEEQYIVWITSEGRILEYDPHGVWQLYGHNIVRAEIEGCLVRAWSLSGRLYRHRLCGKLKVRHLGDECLQSMIQPILSADEQSYLEDMDENYLQWIPIGG
jgi:hypothetical protein